MLEELLLCIGALLVVASLGFNIFVAITLSNNSDYYNICEPYVYNCLLYILIIHLSTFILSMCKYCCAYAISHESLSSIEVVSNTDNKTNNTDNNSDNSDSLVLEILCNMCPKFITFLLNVSIGIWVFICYYTADRECYRGTNLWEILTVYLVFSYIYFCIITINILVVIFKIILSL